MGKLRAGKTMFTAYFHDISFEMLARMNGLPVTMKANAYQYRQAKNEKLPCDDPGNCDSHHRNCKKGHETEIGATSIYERNRDATANEATQ